MQDESFGEKKLKTNIIARPLGMWCYAIYDFTLLKRSIEPLESNVREMQVKLNQAEKEYERITKDLQICTNEYQGLLNDYNKMIESKNKLESLIEESKVKLQRAEILTTLLSDEEHRWKQAVVNLE